MAKYERNQCGNCLSFVLNPLRLPDDEQATHMGRCDIIDPPPCMWYDDWCGEHRLSKSMTNTELIAIQAKKIEEYEAEIREFIERIRLVRLQMISVGGPLNDNFLLYSREQLAPFFRIKDILDG